jgi:hypothetical protein
VVFSQQTPDADEMARGESERVRLARVALTAALGTPGVRATASAEGTLVTETASGALLHGVSCVAARSGGYDVSLGLVCDLVALHPLGERIREAVLCAAAIAGLQARSVNVHFAGVTPAGERQ